MQFGLIARSERDRGLGIQSKAIYDHLRPDRTLVVLDKKSGYIAHPGDFPGATQISLKHGSLCNRLDQDTVRIWWAGLDVVFSVETLYDWQLVEWAHADGVRTIVQGNPEFYQANRPQPDQWTWPTSWRRERLPDGPVIPVPVPDRPWTAAPPDTPLRAVHVAGSRALGDRNGTDLVLNAARRFQRDIRLTIYSQVPVAGSKRCGEDRWHMYSGHHVLLLPRRYGGLSLQAQEAMASGLAVMMPRCSPNLDWPIIPLDGDTGRTYNMQTGPVQTFDAYLTDIANQLQSVNNNRHRLNLAMEQSRQWADDNRWSVHAQTYYDLLEDVARR